MNKHKLALSQLGAIAFVATVKGQPVTTQYAVVELASLIMSNHLNGEVNELYPQELQPRDRTQPESVKKVWESSKGIALSWLSKSDSSASGSPITGESLIVESGNGRSMAIRKAYYDGQAENYRTRLEQASEQFGIESEIVQAMREPVLIRIRLTEMDAAQFARDSNHDNGESSQADKSIIVGMLESVGDDIEGANTIAEVKIALLKAFPPERPQTNSADQFIEAVSDQVVDLLRPSFEQRNGAKFGENLRIARQLSILNGLSYQAEIKVLKRSAVLLFNDEGAEDDWLDMIRLSPEIFEFQSMYNAFYGNDYDAAKYAYNWKLKNKGKLKSGQLDHNLLNHFMEKKITKRHLTRFADASIDALDYDNNPISSLVAENQFIVDHLTAALDNPIPMTQDEQLQAFESYLIKNEVINPSPNGERLSIESISFKLTEGMAQGKENAIKAAIERESRGKGFYATEAVKKEVTKRYEDLYKRHISKDMMTHTHESLVKFFETGELPPTAFVGMACYDALLSVEKKRLYEQAMEPMYEYLDSVMDDYELTGAEIKGVKPSVELKLAAIGMTFEKDVKPYVDTICALASGTLPSITFEYGDSNPKLKERAYATGNNISIGDDIQKHVIWHEYGHIIENNHPEIKNAALALIKSRHSRAVAKPKVVKLKKYHKWARINEYIVDNYKVEPYESKFYPIDEYYAGDIDYAWATELVSKGFEWIANKNTAYKLMVDKELFKIIMAGIALMKNKASK